MNIKTSFLCNQSVSIKLIKINFLLPLASTVLPQTPISESKGF